MVSEGRSTKNEFLRGPKWRTRTSPGRRHRAAALTFGMILLVGLGVMWLASWSIGWLGVPTWIVLLPWLLPTAGAIVWTLARPMVAEVSDDDDDSWFGYSIRWALVGELDPRPAPARVVAALLFGAPVAWAIGVSGLLTLTGLL